MKQDIARHQSSDGEIQQFAVHQTQEWRLKGSVSVERDGSREEILGQTNSVVEMSQLLATEIDLMVT